MNNIISFPKIFSLGSPQTRGLLEEEVEVTEKVDGSQFGFGVDLDGVLHVRSKGAVIDIDNPPHLFIPAVEHVKELHNRKLIPRNKIFHGETLCKPKHNTIKYDRTPVNNIALFNSFDWDGKNPVPHKYLEEYYGPLFFMSVVPLLFKGIIPPEHTHDFITTALDNESFLGGHRIEGVVVRRLLKTPIENYGSYSYIWAGKYVSEEFKEKNKKNPEFSSSKNKIDLLLEEYNAVPRWEKAVQFYKEQGLLEGNPRDIGKLIERVQQDVVEETEEELKEILWNLFKPQLRKAAVRGLPEWYKDKLLNNFNDE